MLHFNIRECGQALELQQNRAKLVLHRRASQKRAEWHVCNSPDTLWLGEAPIERADLRYFLRECEAFQDLVWP